MALQTTKGSGEVMVYTGLKRDPPDPRDIEKVYGAPDIPSSADHPVVDLRKYVKHIYAQGKMGSCGANVACAAYELLLEKQAEGQGHAHYHFYPSRLFVYFNSRIFDRSIGRDDGSCLRDNLRVIKHLGVCRESLWPYDVQKITTRPPQVCYDDAKGNAISKYEYLRQDIDQLRASLKAGFPVGFGFKMYKTSFLTMIKGVLTMPTPEEISSTPDPDLHGVLAVGYNDNTKYITVLNSWGDKFGDNGYFYMPYDYISDPSLAFNFWKMEQSTEKYEVEIHTLPL